MDGMLRVASVPPDLTRSPRGRRRPTPWILLLVLPAVALAQSSGGSYTLRKQAIAGGVVASGGSYRLTGTVGQPAAAVQQAGSYRLTGGFHGPAGAAGDRLLCSGFENTPCP